MGVFVVTHERRLWNPLDLASKRPGGDHEKPRTPGPPRFPEAVGKPADQPPQESARFVPAVQARNAESIIGWTAATAVRLQYSAWNPPATTMLLPGIAVASESRGWRGTGRPAQEPGNSAARRPAHVSQPDEYTRPEASRLLWIRLPSPRAWGRELPTSGPRRTSGPLCQPRGRSDADEYSRIGSTWAFCRTCG